MCVYNYLIPGWGYLSPTWSLNPSAEIVQEVTIDINTLRD